METDLSDGQRVYTDFSDHVAVNLSDHISPLHEIKEICYLETADSERITDAQINTLSDRISFLWGTDKVETGSNDSNSKSNRSSTGADF